MLTSRKSQVCRGCQDCDSPTLARMVKVASENGELVRVRGKIGTAVLAFLKGRIKDGNRTFYINELQKFVEGFVLSGAIAPASPDRVLRNLRQRGEVDYELLDRSNAEYRVKRVIV